MRWSSTTALPLALTAWLVGACTWLVGASASPAQVSSEDPVAKGGDDGRFLGRRQAFGFAGFPFRGESDFFQAGEQDGVKIIAHFN